MTGQTEGAVLNQRMTLTRTRPLWDIFWRINCRPHGLTETSSCSAINQVIYEKGVFIIYSRVTEFGSCSLASQETLSGSAWTTFPSGLPLLPSASFFQSSKHNQCQLQTILGKMKHSPFFCSRFFNGFPLPLKSPFAYVTTLQFLKTFPDMWLCSPTSHPKW